MSNKKISITILASEDQTYKEVAKFYNKSPFPSYQKGHNKNDILSLGNKNLIARKFKELIGQNKDVLEAGCGTGQLSAYLAIGTNNRIVSMDSAIGSLKVFEDFLLKNNLKNVKLINADILKKNFKNNSFDFIWCSGVLHHTKNPKRGFELLCENLKQNGYIMIGLYNRYGRILTLINAMLYKYISKKIVFFTDPYLRKLSKNYDKNKEKIDAWIQDQFIHPVESLHTFDEVIGWFNDNNIKFVSSYPLFDRDEEINFNKGNNPGSKIDRFFSQIRMIFDNTGKEGGLFVVLGKKI